MSDRTCDPDREVVLHPAHAFGHPSNVLDDVDLTLKEKRSILASWEPDACEIEPAPDCRSNKRGSQVPFDDIWKRCGRSIDRLTVSAIGAYSIPAACSAAVV